MRPFTYHGPISSVSLRVEQRIVDVYLAPGAVVMLPDGHRYTRRLQQRGWLVPVTPATETVTAVAPAAAAPEPEPEPALEDTGAEYHSDGDVPTEVLDVVQAVYPDQADELATTPIKPRRRERRKQENN